MAGTDPAARFRSIYVGNYTRILGYALRRAEGTDDAADVVAETFMTAWRRIDEVPSGDEARLWLYGVARRMLANQRRGTTRRTRLAERLRQDLRHLRALESAAGSEDVSAFEAAFRALRPKDKELLGLVAWEGLGIEELGRVLICSPNAAKVRLHRARKRFAGELAERGVDVKRMGSPGHVGIGRVVTRPDIEEAR